MKLADRIARGRRAIALAKQRGLDTTQWERHLRSLLDEASRQPGLDEGFEPWALQEWRRESIPDWRRILRDSIGRGDRHREQYARWMLREVLLDPEYVGDEQ